MPDKCKYYEWDEDGSVLPVKYQLGETADLADALEVFWSAGGFDFFCVTKPEYYATNWLEFLGMLYSQIEEGEFEISDKTYIVPLTAEQKDKLLSQGVPLIFVTDLNV